MALTASFATALPKACSLPIHTQCLCEMLLATWTRMQRVEEKQTPKEADTSGAKFLGETKFCCEIINH